MHRKAAASLSDAVFIADFATHTELQSKGILQPIGDSTGYIVQSMNYGTPYLHKEAVAMLEEIEERFVKGLKEANLPKAQFVISSASRTEEQQDRLRGRNRNATKGTSSHSYGASIDIPRVIGTRCSESRTILVKILSEMQAEKKLYLCPESNTIHVTVR